MMMTAMKTIITNKMTLMKMNKRCSKKQRMSSPQNLSSYSKVVISKNLNLRHRRSQQFHQIGRAVIVARYQLKSKLNCLQSSNLVLHQMKVLLKSLQNLALRKSRQTKQTLLLCRGTSKVLSRR